MLSLLELFKSQPLECALVVVGASLLFSCAVLWFSSKRAGLSHIPGPFVARYTNLWAVYVAWRTDREGNRAPFNRALQARYGDVVRIGPHNVSVMDPAAIPVIYGVRSRLDKVSGTSRMIEQEQRRLTMCDDPLGRCLHSVPAIWRDHEPSKYTG